MRYNKPRNIGKNDKTYLFLVYITALYHGKEKRKRFQENFI